MGKGVYEITQRGSNRRYLVQLVSDEGEVLLTSQYREQQPMCLNEVSWMRVAGGKDSMYERVDDEGGEWYFVLHANDAHVLGTSPRFASEREREACIEAVKRMAADADLVDTTPQLDLSTKMHGFLQGLAREAEAAR